MLKPHDQETRPIR